MVAEASESSWKVKWSLQLKTWHFPSKYNCFLSWDEYFSWPALLFRSKTRACGRLKTCTPAPAESTLKIVGVLEKLWGKWLTRWKGHGMYTQHWWYLAFCYGKPREEKTNPHHKPQSSLKRFALTEVCIRELARAQDWRTEQLLGG